MAVAAITFITVSIAVFFAVARFGDQNHRGRGRPQRADWRVSQRDQIDCFARRECRIDQSNTLGQIAPMLPRTVQLLRRSIRS